MKADYVQALFLKNRRTRFIDPKPFGAVLLSLLLLFLYLPQTIFASQLSDLQKCLLEVMETAADDTTMGEMRENCLKKIEGAPKTEVDETTVSTADTEEGAIDRRLAVDKKHALAPYSLMSHKPNYILVASYNSSGINAEPFKEQFDDPDLEMQDVEAKFQLSVKMPLLVGLFKDRVDVFAAYTNRSFWQVYNTDNSAPFRETNHEPETWVQIRNDWGFWGFKNPVNAFGFVHQSNGRGGVLSRSWNRLYASFLFERKNLAIGIKPWYRISESDEDDDNPDITDYLGHGELRAAYKWHNHTFSMMLRNQLESGFDRGAVELGWSFPLWKYPYLKGYVQYFNGYGESLIDYDQRANSIGAGLLITDWL
jgi:phospholipase A1/A2